MKNNLILVIPESFDRTSNYPEIPISAAVLAGAARDSGICDTITIFDFNIPFGSGKTYNDLTALIESLPKGNTAVGICCLYSGYFPSVRRIAAKIKQSYPDVKTVTGGAHSTLFASEIIQNCPEIDAVAIAEADNTFPKLLSYYMKDGSVQSPEGFFLRVNGEIIKKPQAQYIHNLDLLPKPGYEYFNFADYAADMQGWWNPDNIETGSIVMPLQTARGCPQKCNFCAVQVLVGDRFRPRSAENIFEEIKYLYNKYNVRYYRLYDDNFALNRKRALRFCELIINSEMKVYFDVPSGLSIKSVDEEVIHKMRQAGFIFVTLAVESGSDYIRDKVMGKKLSHEEIIKAFQICRKANINTGAFFMVAMPEDTEETLKETADLMQEIEVDRVFLSVVRPTPGTRLFEQCIRDKLFVNDVVPETLWTGDVEVSRTKTNVSISRRGVSASVSPERPFYLKPYNLSIERLTEIDVELQKIAYDKSKAWIERAKSHLYS